MGSTGGSLHPTPSEGVHLRRYFALRYTNSCPFAPPPNNPTEETQKHAASRRKEGRGRREKTESTPKKPEGGHKRSRKTEKGAGWEAHLAPHQPDGNIKHKNSKKRAPLSPLLWAMYAKPSLSSALERTKSCASSQSQHSRRGHKRNEKVRKRGIAESASPSLQNRRQDQHTKRT